MQAHATRPLSHVPLPLPSRSDDTHSDSLVAADFKLSSIDLYITSACNRRCTYCFLSDAFFESGQSMSVESVQSICDWAAEGSVEEITLLGGEPALHPDFPLIVSTIHDAGLRVRTVTNGSRKFRIAMENRTVRSLLGRVAVSLDSPSEAAFDALRGRGAFRDAMATMRWLAEQKKAFDINFTVVKSALDSVPEMLSLAEQLGAGRLNVHWFSLVGRARTHAAHQAVSAAEWREVLRQVSSYRPRRSDFVIDCELGFAYGLSGEEPGMCAVRDRSNLQFLPDGSVFSCGMLVDRPDLAGYAWRDNGLFLRQADTEVTRTASPCSGCPMRNVQVNDGDEDGHATLCIYNRLARS